MPQTPAPLSSLANLMNPSSPQPALQEFYTFQYGLSTVTYPPGTTVVVVVVVQHCLRVALYLLASAHFYLFISVAVAFLQVVLVVVVVVSGSFYVTFSTS